MPVKFILTIALLDPTGHQVAVIHEHANLASCSEELKSTRDSFKTAQKGYALRWAECSPAPDEKAPATH